MSLVINETRLNELEALINKIREFQSICEEYEPVLERARELGIVERNPLMELKKDNSWYEDIDANYLNKKMLEEKKVMSEVIK